MEKGDRPSSATSRASKDKQIDADVHDRRGRSLPPWIDSYDVSYGTPPDDQLKLLNRPPKTVAPNHNSHPAPPSRRRSRDGYIDWDGPLEDDKDVRRSKYTPAFMTKRRFKPGRKWDHMRTAEPVVMTGYMARNAASPWQGFVQSSQYGHAVNEESEVVDSIEFEKLQPGFNEAGMLPSHFTQDPKRSRRQRTKAFYIRLWNVTLRHPMVPGLLRLMVLFTSIISLSLSAILYHSDGGPSSGNVNSQSIVGIVVDVLVVPYVFYMIWDEYTGKPLGLRHANQKIALTLMDLFFIIFKSASATLAFESLVFYNPHEPKLRALASFELVGLIGWVMTFTINVFRLVQRLGGGDGLD